MLSGLEARLTLQSLLQIPVAQCLVSLCYCAALVFVYYALLDLMEQTCYRWFLLAVLTFLIVVWSGTGYPLTAALLLIALLLHAIEPGLLNKRL